jgi:hypothetical protein
MSARRWSLLLSALLLCAYVPSFAAGFLNYDDDWLIEQNPYLTAPLSRALPAMLFDFTKPVRMDLGAEYLPVRDLFLWLEVQLFGVHGPSLHTVSIGLYLAAVLCLRAGALRTLGQAWWVELAVLLFALHPVHAESVAWLSGQKDLLALLFVCAALWLHAGSSRHARWGVPVLVGLALFSKSMSVAVLVLLVAHDLYVARRPDPWRYLGSVLVIAGAMSLHMKVGDLVHMWGPPAGGSYASALMTMSVVMLRYLGTACFPVACSMRYDVPDRLAWDLPSAAGVACVLALALAAWLAWRRGQRLPAWALLWFFGPLLPVSQLLMQLENRMQDRYLWLSVFAPCVLFAWSLERLRARLPRVGVVGALVATALLMLSLQRSVLFSDPVLLFSDALAKTELDTHAPYHLGWAFELRGQEELAIVAYRQVSERIPPGADMPPGGRDKIVRAERARARLLAKHGRIDEANAVLAQLQSRFTR